jgi:Zn-dependent protease/CBS domain-containing protein
MRGSIRIARIAGIYISIHYTWIFIFLLVMWTLSTNFFPQLSPGHPVIVYWGLGALSAVLFFISVLLHELAHSLYARAHGVAVTSIVLFIFGGVSNLPEDPHRAREEFWMALLGPLTSLALAGVFWGLLSLVPDTTAPVASMLYYLAIINALLGAFNLLPGFPLDGGRVFRAIVWGITGDRARATRLAAILGQVVAWGLIFGGVYFLFKGNILQGIWMALIGWFLNNAADASRREVTLEQHISGVRVAAVMDPAPPVNGPETSVDTLVREIFIHQGRPAAPVTDGGAVSGIVTLSDVKGLPRDAWHATPVSKIMTRAPLYSVGPDDDLMTAMGLIGDHHLDQLLVIEDGRLVGMLRRADILRYLHVSRELRLPRRGRRPDEG